MIAYFPLLCQICSEINTGVRACVSVAHRVMGLPPSVSGRVQRSDTLESVTSVTVRPRGILGRPATTGKRYPVQRLCILTKSVSVEATGCEQLAQSRRTQPRRGRGSNSSDALYRCATSRRDNNRRSKVSAERGWL